MLRKRQASTSRNSFYAKNQLKGNVGYSLFSDSQYKLKKKTAFSTPAASQTVIIGASVLSFTVIFMVFIFMSLSTFGTKTTENDSIASLTDVASTVDTLISTYSSSIESIHYSSDLSTHFAEYDSLLESAIKKHCISQLTFEIEDQNLFWNSLFAHVDLWINSLAHNSVVERLNPKTTFVTNQGTIIDITHSKHATDFKATEYASCDLVQVLIKKSKDMHLVSDSNKYVDEFGIDSDEYWTESLHGETLDHYFENSDVNKDALKLINHAISGNLYDMEMEFPIILKYYCGHVVNALESGKNDNAPHQFISQMNHMLQVISESVTIDAEKEEIPIIDKKDGKLYFIHREELLSSNNDYMQCELLEKLVYFGQADNKISKQTDALINDIVQKTASTNSHMLQLSAAYAFDSRSEIYLEQHCSNVLSALYSKGKMFEFKGNFLSFVENVVSGDHYVGDSDDWIVTNDGSILHRDIALAQGHRDIMECSLIKHISFKGDHSRKLDDQHEHMFDTSTIFNEEFQEELIDIDAHHYSKSKQLEYEFDANVLYEHIINKEHTQFMATLEHMMNYHHSTDLKKMNKNTVERLFSDIQDILEIIAENGNILQFVEGKTESGFSRQTGIWSVTEDSDFNKYDDEVVSPFLNALLRVFIDEYQKRLVTKTPSKIEELMQLVETGDYYESSMKLEKLIEKECKSTLQQFKNSEQMESFHDRVSHLLYHIGTHLSIPTTGSLTFKNNELVYTIDNTATTSCSVITDMLSYGLTQNSKIAKTESKNTIENDISFFKQSFKSSEPNQEKVIYEKKSNSDIKQYVKLLKEDAKKSHHMEQVQKDIIEDLHYFCKDILENLSSRKQRRLRAHILDKVENEISIRNAVITSDGLIQSSFDVDSNEQHWQCEFVSELLQ